MNSFIKNGSVISFLNSNIGLLMSLCHGFHFQLLVICRYQDILNCISSNNEIWFEKQFESPKSLRYVWIVWVTIWSKQKLYIELDHHLDHQISINERSMVYLMKTVFYVNNAVPRHHVKSFYLLLFRQVFQAND